jgi:peptide/nickel transport system substrate-binding protein
MKSKVVSVVLSFLVVLSLVLASCAKPAPTTTTAPPTLPPTTAPPTKANWWDKWGEPQYGGTITVRNFFINAGSFDPTAGMMGGGGFAANIMYEGLAGPDWALDRSIWSYPTGFTPLQYLKGVLLEDEGWELTDPTTITLHVRKGVKWQNRPPVNGREFTADDIVYNLNRVLGAGEFAGQPPNPFLAQQFSAIKEAVATDKYTVQVKLKQPGAVALFQLLGAMFTYAAPEWIKQADPTDPLGVVGTSPWILTDFVAGSKMVFSKNPDYWGYDERHPKNKLPYADTVTQLAIPDPATAQAAMRTGKIDLWTDPMGCITWQSAETLLKTNPDLGVAYQPRPGAVLFLRCDTKPFTDINVRKALNMAIDRKAIAESFYGGYSDGNPCGIIGPAIKGWCAPYDEWPAELKAAYNYDVEGAKKLLEAAGYPEGFEVECVSPASQSPQLLEIIQAMFKDINVTMNINQMDDATYSSYTAAGKQKNMVFSDGMAGLLWAPTTTLAYLISASIPQMNYTFNYDAGYDEIFAKIMAATDPAEMEKLSREADLYALEHFWLVPIVSSNTQCVVWQPYIKGYSGEVLANADWAAALRARVWIDQALKKSMGR